MAGDIGQFFPVFFMLGDVVLSTEKMGDVAVFIRYRGNIQLVPEHAAVFAVVSQFHPYFMAVFNRGGNLITAGLLAVFALKKTAIGTNNVFGGITGHVLKGAVNINN